MVRTKDELEKVKRKRKQVYKHMEFGKRMSPRIHRIVTKGLSELVKNNNSEFMCDMYIDFLDSQIIRNGIMSQFQINHTNSVYHAGFISNNEDEFVEKLFYFSRYLLSRYNQNNEGYYNYIERKYYPLNKLTINDKRIFELKDYVDTLMTETKDLYTHSYNESIIKLMAYIMSQDKILLSKEYYQELLNSLRDNYSFIFDNYIINNERFDINDPNIDPNTVIYFFNPKEFVDNYEKSFYNKLII